MKKKQKLLQGNVWYIVAFFLLYCVSMFAVTGGICPVRGMFGIPCPACGSTRAMLLFVKGDFIGCMRMNPAAPFLFLCLVNEIRIGYFKRGNKKVAAVFLIITVVVSLAVYIIRMRLYFPYREPYVFESRSFLFRLLRLYPGPNN